MPSMKAVFFDNGKVAIKEKDIPEPGEGEVLIKVLISGVCNTDIELVSGYYNFSGVPGHEFVGRVEKAPGHPELVGLKAAASINIGCGRCSWCLSGDQRHCPDRKAIGIKGHDGAFAEYLIAPAKNIYPAPPELALEEAVFTEPLAAALQVMEAVHLTPDMKTAVLGDGKLGLLAALALSRVSPGLVLLGKHENKLEIAEKQGVTTRLVENGQSLRDITEPFDLVVEATGRPEGINLAIDLLRPRGIVVAKTTSHLPSSINLAKLVVDEIKIVGSRCGDFNLALNFLKNGLIDPKPLIEAVYPFSSFVEAFNRARRKGAGKILIMH